MTKGIGFVVGYSKVVGYWGIGLVVGNSKAVGYCGIGCLFQEVVHC